MYRAKYTSSNKSALSMRVAAALSMPCSSNHRSFDVSRRVTIEGARPRRPEANEITRTEFPFVSLSIHGVQADQEFVESVVSRFDDEEDRDRRSFRFFVTRQSLLSNSCSTRLSRWIFFDPFINFFPLCQYIAKFLSRRVTYYEEKNYARFLK